MHKARGFTLIELMIVVAVVAILAAIALPSFNEQVRKSRRSDAIRGLAEVQLAQERWRASNASYATTAQLAMPVSDHYTIAVTSNSATGWAATAVPKNTSSQKNDKCGTYTFTMAAGVVTKSAGADNAVCF